MSLVPDMRPAWELREHLKQRNDTITALRAENEKLRAALRPLACTCEARHQADCSRSEVDCPFWNARAALEGKA